MQQAQQRVLDQLTREQIVSILQNEGGYQCYDSESTDYLRGVLRSDIDTGILPASILPESA
ncbi:hypothetical protein G3A43_07105 [Paraburkholderia aspalathi]|nr:hypothetical protein [Paraburkholderia aspalathi]MBK3780020.1 hypothetical protein [Paraburkholderia aspalathi]